MPSSCFTARRTLLLIVVAVCSAFLFFENGRVLRAAAAGPETFVVNIDAAFDAPDLPTDAGAERLRAILNNAVKYALGTWYAERGFDTQTGPFLDFGGVTDDAKWAAAETSVIAIALRTGAYDPEVSGRSTASAEAQALRLISSLAALHRANVAGGWGGQWHSGTEAAETALAGWLLWDRLGVEERGNLARLVEFEADRFIGSKVPYYRDREGVILRDGDTASEENAWNAQLLSLAVAMMPQHPRATLWAERQIELMLSAYARPSDVNNSVSYHGRPVSKWLQGSNIEANATVINHGILHPVYMTAALLTQGTAALYYTLAGRPAPSAAFFNVEQVYAALVDLQFDSAAGWALPGGTIYPPGAYEIYYPQGSDHPNERVMGFLQADVYAGLFGLDRLASTRASVFEQLHGNRSLERQARFADGRSYGAEELPPAGLEEWIASRAARAYLARWVAHHVPIQMTNAPTVSGPVIGRLVPTVGAARSVLSVEGAHLEATRSVQVGGKKAKFSIVSAGILKVTVPQGASIGPVTVVTPDGTAVSSQSFGVIQPPSITGRVTDYADRAIAAGRVDCTTGAGASFVANTDADGYYACASLPAGTYTVTVSHAQHAVIPDGPAVTVQSGTKPTKAVLDFVALREPYIVGRVRSGTSYFSGILVTRDDGVTTKVRVVTDKNGYYGFSGMGAGTYAIAASSDAGPLYATVRTVTIGPAGGVAGVDFSSAASIEGRVIDRLEHPIEGVTISHTGPGGASSAITDQQGRYRIPGVRAGQHQVSAAKAGFDFTPGKTFTLKADHGKGISFVGTPQL